MTRSLLTRLVLGLAVLAAPASFVGCSEESKPAADAPAVTPAPAPATATPGETPKTDAPAAPAK